MSALMELENSQHGTVKLSHYTSTVDCIFMAMLEQRRCLPAIYVNAITCFY